MKIKLLEPLSAKSPFVFIITTGEDVLIATSKPYKNREECVKAMHEVKWRSIFASILLGGGVS